jgi:hypothetical protein
MGRDAPPNFGAFQLLLDSPTDTPGLGFGPRAEQFAQLIRSSPPRFAIGIFARWGLGKTTLMNAIRDQLLRANRASDSIIVEFNAWRYEREPHLMVPLLDCIHDSIDAWQHETRNEQKAKKVLGALRRVGRAFARSLTIKVPAGPAGLEIRGATAIDTLEEGNTDPAASMYYAAFRQLHDGFEDLVKDDGQVVRRIVVFVDDLDRCLPERALEVLENMKLFFDLEGFVFVVGLDSEVVNRAVAAKFGSEQGNLGDQTTATASPSPSPMLDGDQYVKKLFQVGYALPPIDPGEIDNLLKGLAETPGLPPEQVREIKERISAHLTSLDDVAINPRDVKRIINLYILNSKLLTTRDFTPQPDITLAIQVISSRIDWGYLWTALLADARYFQVELKAAQNGGEVAGRPLPKSFKNYAARVPALSDETVDLNHYIKIIESSRSSDLTVATALGAIRKFRNAEKSAAPRTDHAAWTKAVSDADSMLSAARSQLTTGMPSVANPEAQAAVIDLSNLTIPYPQSDSTFSNADFSRTWATFLDQLEKIDDALVPLVSSTASIGAVA